MECPDLILMTFPDHVSSRNDPFIILVWLADHSYFTIYAVYLPISATLLIQKHFNFCGGYSRVALISKLNELSTNPKQNIDFYCCN